MKCCLPIVFILSTFLSGAQGGWKKKYHLQNSFVSVCRNVIEAPNGNLIMVGLTYDTIGNPGCNRLSIVGTDPLGNMLWRKDYGSIKFEYLDNILAPNGAIVQEGNYFYHTLGVRDSNNKYIGALIKFDYNGDTIWQKMYRDPDPLEDVIPQGMTKSVEGGFLLTGFFQHWGTNSNKCLVIKTDANGNELWRKKIGKAVPDVQDGRSIVQDSATKKIVIVGYQYIGSANYSETHSNILILDHLGNKLVQTTFNNAGGGGFSNVIQLKDKTFLACGATNANNDIGALTRYRGLVVKFEINGNTIWSRTYDTLSPFTGIMFMNQTSNEDIILVGGLDTLRNYGLLGPRRIRLYKIDNNGDLKWKKYIGSAYTHTSSEYMRSLNPTQDGGFIMAAWMLSAPSSFKPPYSIIKVDSTGCDTLDAWCKSVALNVNDHQLNGLEFSVFPNPVKDKLQLEFEAILPGDLKLTISNAIGQVVFSKNKISQKEEIDLSFLKTGIYFVRLESRAGLKTVKIVKE